MCCRGRCRPCVSHFLITETARRNSLQARKVDEFLGVRGSTLHHRIAKQFVAIRDAKWFQSFIIGVIFLASALVGIQTYQITDPDVNNVLTTLDTIVLYVFIVEIVRRKCPVLNVPFVADTVACSW